LRAQQLGWPRSSTIRLPGAWQAEERGRVPAALPLPGVRRRGVGRADRRSARRDARASPPLL